MISAYRGKSIGGIVGGIVLSGVGFGLVAAAEEADSEGMAIAGGLLLAGGGILYLWGCVMYAKGKGYSGWLGLLALLNWIGLIILAVLPDKCRDGQPPAQAVAGPMATQPAPAAPMAVAAGAVVPPSAGAPPPPPPGAGGPPPPPPLLAGGPPPPPQPLTGGPPPPPPPPPSAGGPPPPPPPRG